jgi:myosin heavy subunit
MKKSLYLKLSQREANKKVQLSLVEKYKSIRQKNRLLGYLYFTVAYISYSSVAIISFIHRWVMISKDFRFTPHYLQTVIDYDNMGVEQANQYLNTQLNEYKKSRSYGNFSLAQRDAINVTFELLLDRYRLPEPEDTKHTAILSGLSTIENISLENGKDILNLNSDMKEVSAELSSQMKNQNAITGKRLTNIEQSVIEGTFVAKESMSALSDRLANQEQRISSQIQNQNNQLKEELSKTNDKISESTNTLSEQNNTIKEEIINVSQSVNDTLDGMTSIADKVGDLSTQQKKSFSDTQEKLENIHSGIDVVKSYTEQKQKQEQSEQERENELRVRQEKRKTSAHNREKGRKLDSFESALSEGQIAILTTYCNKVAVFDRDVEVREMNKTK